MSRYVLHLDDSTLRWGFDQALGYWGEVFREGLELAEAEFATMQGLLDWIADQAVVGSREDLADCLELLYGDGTYVPEHLRDWANVLASLKEWAPPGLVAALHDIQWSWSRDENERRLHLAPVGMSGLVLLEQNGVRTFRPQQLQNTPVAPLKNWMGEHRAKVEAAWIQEVMIPRGWLTVDDTPLESSTLHVHQGHFDFEDALPARILPSRNLFDPNVVEELRRVLWRDHE